MEFDRMKTLRMILEADEADAEEEKDETEETNEEDETPKKKAPSRFKQDDDDVDTDTSTEDEDGEMDGSDADEDDNSDSDDLSDFGNHGGDELPNNEYDPAEVETLNNLMASEADAMNEYLDAARVSKVDVLQRLYADIANEERFHMEQLLFAKSELTGEKYVPRDKDVRKEYEELLALGMDEDTAMATAVDKVGIRVTVSDDDVDKDNESIKEDMKKLEEDVATLEMMYQQIELVSYICEYSLKTNNKELMNEVNLIHEYQLITEDIAPVAQIDKKYSRSPNPFKVLFGLFRGFLKFLRNLMKASQKFMTNIRYRIGKSRQWISKHSLGELFLGEGVFLYLWNDKKNTLDIDGFEYISNLTWELSKLSCQMSKSNDQVIVDAIQYPNPFIINNPAYNKPIGNAKKIAMTLDNVVLMKSKVLFNDQSREYLNKLFFGENVDKPIKIDSSKPADISNLPIYSMFEYMIARLTIYGEKSEKLIEAFAQLEGEPNGIYHTNNKEYHNICSYMKLVGKNFTKLSKIINHDMDKIVKISTCQIPQTSDKADTQQPQQPEQQPQPPPQIDQQSQQTPQQPQQTEQQPQQPQQTMEEYRKPVQFEYEKGKSFVAYIPTKLTDKDIQKTKGKCWNVVQIVKGRLNGKDDIKPVESYLTRDEAIERAKMYAQGYMKK